MPASSKTKQVVITRTFNASIERVWDAFTKVEDILAWHSPVGMINPFAEVDLRVDGKYAITMEYIENKRQVTVRGVYKTIEKTHPFGELRASKACLFVEVGWIN